MQKKPPIIQMELSPDEAMALHHAFTNGLQTGNPTVRRSLTVKVERAASLAQAMRGLHSSYDIRDAHNGQEKTLF